MAFQSVWYYTDLPQDIVDIIERDVSETFDEQMGDSKLHGDALNKEKRNSQNAWIPTTHWVGGFLWHYNQRANRENFLYDLGYFEKYLGKEVFVVGKNLNWRGSCGEMTFILQDIKQIFEKLNFGFEKIIFL